MGVPIEAMFKLLNLYKNKRLIACSIIPIGLFLVSLGIRTPHLTLVHSSPTPKPRAVIETSKKTIKHDIARYFMDVELFHNVAELPAPAVFKTRVMPVVHRLNSTMTPQTGARSPPLFASNSSFQSSLQHRSTARTCKARPGASKYCAARLSS